MGATVKQKTFADALPEQIEVTVTMGRRNMIAFVGRGGGESLGRRLIAELSLGYDVDGLTVEGLDQFFEIRSWIDGGKIAIDMK
jgi:hypothetical protein